MRKGTLVCGPDELKVLQQILDSCMGQLKNHLTHRHADEAQLRAAKQVLRHAAKDILDVSTIKRKVARCIPELTWGHLEPPP
jgi:hypothetical protein